MKTHGCLFFLQYLSLCKSEQLIGRNYYQTLLLPTNRLNRIRKNCNPTFNLFVRAPNFRVRFGAAGPRIKSMKSVSHFTPTPHLIWLHKFIHILQDWPDGPFTLPSPMSLVEGPHVSSRGPTLTATWTRLDSFRSLPSLSPLRYVPLGPNTLATYHNKSYFLFLLKL